VSRYLTVRKLRERLLAGGIAGLLVLAACGCDYLAWRRERREWLAKLESNPSLALARKAAPEDCFVLHGEVSFPAGQPRRVLVAAFNHEGTVHELVASHEVVAETGFYRLFLPAGVYDVALLADINDDGFYADDEVVGSTDPAAPVRVGRDTSVDGFIVRSPEIALDFDHPRQAAVTLKIPVRQKPFVVESVDDPLFDPQYGTLGVYYPTQFLTHSQRFVFALGEPNPRLPFILLVHGLSGTPRDFKALIASIDRSKYQILVFNYPSGMPLDKMGSTLAFTMREIERLDPIEPRLVVIAHSMGGLVARRALNEVCGGGRPGWLRLYISWDTPYGGEDSAERGVRGGRDMVPSWRDLATGSSFVEGLYSTSLPKDLPFYLFFGWGNGESRGPNPAGDGTIRLRSQLDPRAQAAATRLLGFEQTHVGILGDPAALGALGSILDETFHAR